MGLAVQQQPLYIDCREGLRGTLFLVETDGGLRPHCFVLPGKTTTGARARAPPAPASSAGVYIVSGT